MQTLSKLNPVAGRTTSRLAAYFTLAATMLLGSLPLRAQIEPVSATSQGVLATSANFMAGGNNVFGPAVTDACNNVYVNTSSGVLRVANPSGAVTTVQSGNNGLLGIYMDAAKQNLYFSDHSSAYAGHFVQTTITNCMPGTLNTGYPSNIGAIADYYIQAPVAITGDGAGNVFFVQNASNGPASPQTIEEVIKSTNAVAVVFTWTSNITMMASDANGTIYFSDGSNKVYKIAAPYTGTATVAASGFVNLASINFDSQGNLYFLDLNSTNINIYYNTSNVAILYEVPLEAAGLNFADKYVVANQLLANSQPGFGSDGTAYFTTYPPSSQQNLYSLQRDKVVFPATTVGGNVTVPVNYYFNAAATPANIRFVQGTSLSSVFTNGGVANPPANACTNQTYAVGGSCTVSAQFNPALPGIATGELVLSDSGSNSLSAVSLSGVGNGPFVSIDPGTLIALTSTLTAPYGAAVDNLGNLYVTDTTANSVTKFAAGTGTATTIATGSLTLKGPKGIAVDSVGDIFIADTGNSRVVEIPVVKGALSPAGSVALTFASALNAPQGVAVTATNDLLVADTGNNRLVFVPNSAGALSTANTTVYSTSLNGPSAVAVDAAGDVFVAETGNKDVLEFIAPLSTATPNKVISALTSPTGLATDASGSVFVADSGNIFRYPLSAGTFGTRQNIGSAVANPLGIATDSRGNLYVTDTADKSVSELARVQASLQFGLVNLNTTSPSQTATVNSSGNQTATIPTPAYIASGNTTAGYNVSTTCASTSLAPGATCTITASFSPTQKYGKAEEDLAIQGNTVSYNPSLALIGSSATIYNTTLTVKQASPAAGTAINAGSPVSFTATVGTGSQTLPAGGSVTFYVNGASVGKVPVTNNAATINLPNGLPQGTAVIISAVYAGDNLNYAGSQGQISVAVVALPSSSALTVTGPVPPSSSLTQVPSPYNNPVSANDVTTNVNGPTFTLSAAVGTGSSTILPGGTVSFYQGAGVLLGVGTVSQGIATITTSALRAGTTNVVENNSYRSDYNVYAVYNGDTYYGPSTTTAVPVTVVAAPPCAFAATPCIAEKTGATFTISPTNPVITISASNNKNSNGYAVVSITSYGGWTGILNFTCSNLPQYTTCNPYPGAPTVTYSTVAATVPPTQVQFFVQTNVPPIVSTAASFPLWMGLGFGLLLLMAGQRFGRDRMRKICSMSGLSVLLFAALAGISGCASGTQSTTQYITPSGTYTINVKVTAAQLDPTNGNGNGTLPNDVNTGSFPITLIIK